MYNLNKMNRLIMKYNNLVFKKNDDGKCEWERR